VCEPERDRRVLDGDTHTAVAHEPQKNGAADEKNASNGPAREGLRGATCYVPCDTECRFVRTDLRAVLERYLRARV
jgi:hypothetical protein